MRGPPGWAALFAVGALTFTTSSCVVAGGGTVRSREVMQAADGDRGAPAVITLDREAPASRRWPLRGSQRWRLTSPALAGEIEGYSVRPSGPPGAWVRLRISTSARRYAVEAFRLGYYRGGAARSVWQSGEQRGVLQPPATFQDPVRLVVVAPWRRSLSVDTTAWSPGVYVFVLRTAGGLQAHVPYVVTSPSARGRVALVVPVTTWQAYNDWGGYSLYLGPTAGVHSHAVSFQRPYAAPGSSQLTTGVVPVVRLAEELSLPLAYATNIDVHESPGWLAGAAAYVSMGHDEYWTPAMRRHVTAARDGGTNLVFLGANTMYWRVRLPAWRGSDTRMIGYRHDAQLDPMQARRPAAATGRFRDGPAPAPESELTGMLYECFPVDAPWRVESGDWFGYAGTGVRHGSVFDHLVGVEADRVYPGGSTPRPLEVVAHTAYSCGGVTTSAQAVYYTTRSGAGVFNAGTLRWTCALAPRCGASLSSRTRRFVRQVTVNVLEAFSAGPAARGHPARDNLARLHLPRVNTVPTS